MEERPHSPGSVSSGAAGGPPGPGLVCQKSVAGFSSFLCSSVRVCVPGADGRATRVSAVCVPGTDGRTTRVSAVCVPGADGRTTRVSAVCDPGADGRATRVGAVCE